MIQLTENIINDAKDITERVIKLLPVSVLGAEKIVFFAKAVGAIPPEQKLALLRFMNGVLSEMLRKEASDIEAGGFGAQGFIWLRVYGGKDRIPELPKLSIDQMAIIILNLLTDQQRADLLKNRNLDFSYTFKSETDSTFYRFRSDAYMELDTLTLNMRAISSKIRKINTLGINQNAIAMMHHHNVKQGIVLITGITGSGKSSTLDALVDMHNETDNCQIIIIAAPIEFVHSSNKAIIKHREVGRDVPTFKDGVIQALRQDPDIIVIGEMRDPETIMAALEVADTGHKVFSTLHTSSAVESLDRIIAEVEPSEQDRVRNRLADVLTAVVSQKLVPSLDGKRVMAKEVLLMTPSVQAAIKNNNTQEIYMMINQSSALGMITMEQDLKNLYTSRKISLEMALSYANNKSRLKQILGIN